ncbi:MAG: hypothetical protein C0397_02860 [Odoribacter sp.]|nr:hypothetical protein [Odoribacter sp.]
MKKSILILTFLFIVALIGLNSCQKDEDPIALPTTKALVGSDKCATCHKPIYDVFVESGHPYKVMKVVNGKQPAIPFMPTAIVPDGYTWNDITYTIGGFGWKMRFIDKNGFNITQVPGSQWNPGNNSRSVYNSTIPSGTEKYTCGNCHTTGWKSVKDGGKPQDGLPGMDGEFFVGGIHCEACHGEGNVHVAAQTAKVSVPSGLNVAVDKTTALCAKCHERRFATHDLKQQTSGGWEMHRSQVEQLSTNKHNTLTCIGCHDPHASTTKDELAKGNGIKTDKTCTKCHTTSKFTTNMHYGATCVQCHMPQTVKNGISYTKYKGDAPNHNFKINTSATATYLTPDASNVVWANADKKGSTLDFVCYQCHKDADNVGGTNSMKSRAELATKAVTFHK